MNHIMHEYVTRIIYDQNESNALYVTLMGLFDELPGSFLHINLFRLIKIKVGKSKDNIDGAKGFPYP